MSKQIQVQLHPPEWPYWHGDIKKHLTFLWCLHCNFEKITQLFLVFHCWICESVADYVYQQRLKYSQVEITKNASTSTNYVILTKRVKVQHDMKPLSNVKSMQIADSEQTSTKFIEIFVPNIFVKSTKAERCTYVMFKQTLCLSVTVKDLNL